MRLGDVGRLRAAFPVDGIGNDPIWNRTAFELTDNDIQLFYARWGIKGQRQRAIDLIDVAQAEVVKALFAGQLPKMAFSALVLHEIPPQPFMADEFVDGLTRLRPSRRGACVFMLETHLAPSAVTDLSWKDLEFLQLTRTASEVVDAARVQRNGNLPYVFWEWATEHIASPLLELGPTIEKAFGSSVAELQVRYSRMIMIDRRTESASLLSLIKKG